MISVRVTNEAAVGTPSYQKQAITLYAEWLSLSLSIKLFLSEVKPIEAIKGTVTPADAQNKIKKY